MKISCRKGVLCYIWIPHVNIFSFHRLFLQMWLCLLSTFDASLCSCRVSVYQLYKILPWDKTRLETSSTRMWTKLSYEDGVWGLCLNWIVIKILLFFYQTLRKRRELETPISSWLKCASDRPIANRCWISCQKHPSVQLAFDLSRTAPCHFHQAVWSAICCQ